MSNTDRFKFRVWDKRDLTYLISSTVIFNDGTLFDCYDGYEVRPMLNERYIVEQCTGLRDKLGKLIYEGDSVNLSPADDEEYKNRLVCWCRDHWGTKKLDSPDVWSFSTLDEMEVVGNIHERTET